MELWLQEDLFPKEEPPAPVDLSQCNPLGSPVSSSVCLFANVLLLFLAIIKWRFYDIFNFIGLSSYQTVSSHSFIEGLVECKYYNYNPLALFF